VADATNLARHPRSFHLHIEPGFTFEHLVFNVDPTYNSIRNPLQNKKVRQALALALDKQKVIEQALSLSQKATNRIIAWTPWIITPQLTQSYADREITGQWDPLADGGKGTFTDQTGSGRALSDARRLLAQTPWKRGFTLDFYTNPKPERLAVMALAAQQWRKIGVTVKQHVVTSDQFFSPWEKGGLLAHGAFQVALFAEAGGANPDDLAFSLESRYISRGQAKHTGLDVNAAGIRDSIIDRSFERAIHTNNRTVRRREFRLVQRELNQQGYWIPLYYVPNVSATNHRVVGFHASPFFQGDTWNVYAWKATP
jgi:ABC-type transport system substrate-binding protein